MCSKSLFLSWNLLCRWSRCLPSCQQCASSSSNPIVLRLTSPCVDSSPLDPLRLKKLRVYGCLAWDPVTNLEVSVVEIYSSNRGSEKLDGTRDSLDNRSSSEVNCPITEASSAKSCFNSPTVWSPNHRSFDSHQGLGQICERSILTLILLSSDENDNTKCRAEIFIKFWSGLENLQCKVGTKISQMSSVLDKLWSAPYRFLPSPLCNSTVYKTFKGMWCSTSGRRADL